MYVTLCILSICTACIRIEPQGDAEEVLFKQFAQKYFNKTGWISFDAQIVFRMDGESIMHTTHASYSHFVGNSSLYLQLDSLSFKKVDADEYCYVDIAQYELTRCERKKDTMFFEMMKLNTECKIGYLPVFFQSFMDDFPSFDKIDLLRHIDTIVRGVPCIVFIGLDEEHKSTICSTGETWIEQNECQYWINKESGLLDSLVCLPIKNEKINKRDTYIVTNLDYSDKSQYYDTIFNFESQEYNGYSRCNDYSSRSSEVDTISDALVNYPIVRLSGDTTSLGRIEGWVLLNLWSFHCSTCISELVEWGKEKDSLGYRPLIKEGIEIVSVNYGSNNMELIEKTATKTNSRDILCSAKGMGEYIKLPFLGYNYLISPEKKIVYKTSYLNDYSELLKAKADWEKQHQKD